jgi:threonylcarbamoyladenosine tRNA methylthiotransferase MtaB
LSLMPMSPSLTVPSGAPIILAMKVALYTLGCKLNQAETESIVEQFGRPGFQVVAPDDVADVYIANTCTVTHVADRKSRHWLRMARRRNPQALVIAAGCYAHRSPEELADIADLVVDNIEKENLLELVQNLAHEDAQADEDEAEQPQLPAAMFRTRSLIKIQDGCHDPCAYCIVPRVRSHAYSVPVSRIIEDAKQKVASGYREVVLTGTKVGSYSNDGTDLGGLLGRILRETYIERLHLSSLQPSEISTGFLGLWQDKRLCRHFHLALQSGSGGVLRRMKRSYSLDQYATTMSLIRETMPDAAITTDVIVGFPGESDDEFDESHSFCRQAGFANIHVFPFSPRPETPAEKMPGQIKDRTKRERTQRMLDLSRSSRRRFCQQFLGQIMPVLWERETGPGSGVYSGLTNNYIRVFAKSEKPLSNEIAPVKLLEYDDQAMLGEMVP